MLLSTVDQEKTAHVSVQLVPSVVKPSMSPLSDVSTRPSLSSQSVPVKPLFGVYVNDPFDARTTTPFAGPLIGDVCRVRVSPSGSPSLPRTPGAAIVSGVSFWVT